MERKIFDLAVRLTQDLLPEKAAKATWSVWGKCKRKISGKGAVRAVKRFILFVTNEDIDDIIKIIEPLEKSILLVDGRLEQ